MRENNAASWLGLSWQSSEVFGTGGAEGEVVELFNGGGELMFNYRVDGSHCRHNHCRSTYRQFAAASSLTVALGGRGFYGNRGEPLRLIRFKCRYVLHVGPMTDHCPDGHGVCNTGWGGNTTMACGTPHTAGRVAPHHCRAAMFSSDSGSTSRWRFFNQLHSHNHVPSRQCLGMWRMFCSSASILTAPMLTWFIRQHLARGAWRRRRVQLVRHDHRRPARSGVRKHTKSLQYCSYHRGVHTITQSISEEYGPCFL